MTESSNVCLHICLLELSIDSISRIRQAILKYVMRAKTPSIYVANGWVLHMSVTHVIVIWPRNSVRGYSYPLNLLSFCLKNEESLTRYVENNIRQQMSRFYAVGRILRIIIHDVGPVDWEMPSISYSVASLATALVSIYRSCLLRLWSNTVRCCSCLSAWQRV